MDAFARSAIIAERVLNESSLPALKTERYSSFDKGDGERFEKGELDLAGLYAIGKAGGEPAQISGKQERYEQIINDCLM